MSSRRFLRTSSQLQSRYINARWHGCFIDRPGLPEKLRKIARRADDRFLRTCRNGYRAEEVMGSDIQGSGRGKRAVHFQHFMAIDPLALTGFQDFGNCTSWMEAEKNGIAYAVDIVVKKEPHEYIARPGTALVYGSRGYSSQGMALSDAAYVSHNVGIQLMTTYCDGKYDFREENNDETFGNNWGRSGVPSDMLAAVDGTRVEQVSRVTDPEACLDLLYNGYALGHGSTKTARPNGGLISTLQSIGGHAQAWIGYDDTEEFRDWYQETTGKRLTQAVCINDQSWGDWNNFPDRLWPDHLWGPRPQGAWVVTLSDQARIINEWGDCYANSDVVGFPARQIPPWEDALGWL